MDQLRNIQPHAMPGLLAVVRCAVLVLADHQHWKLIHGSACNAGALFSVKSAVVDDA
jgi:hypothetical protein